MTGIGIGAGLGVLAGRRLSYSPLTQSTLFNTGVGAFDQTVRFLSSANNHINVELPATVGFWYKTAATGVQQCAMSKWNNAGPGEGWLIETTDADKWRMQIRDGADSVNTSLNAVVGMDAAWHIFTLTYDGSQTGAGAIIYVDGVAPAQSPGTVGVPTNSANADPMLIGGRDTGPIVWEFTGYMCHSFKFAEELTPTEVAYISSLGVPMNLPLALPSRTLLHWCTNGDGCGYAADAYLDISGNAEHGSSLNFHGDEIQGDVPP